MNLQQKWKRRLAALCVCTGLFCALALPGAAQETTENVTVKQVMQAYQQVLLGQRPYLQAGQPDGQQVRFTAQVTQWGSYRFEQPFTYTRFCLADLDADGYPEVILDLTGNEGNTFGYQLLRYDGGQVYGFAFGLRSFQDFTLEGDVLTSGGAGNNGWYTLVFSAGEADYAETCRMQSTNEDTQYFIGGNAVTQEAYLAFTDQIMQKPRPVWLDFTDANVAFVVGQFT